MASNETELAAILKERLVTQSRVLVAIAGPPGAGKSTLASSLSDSLKNGRFRSVVVPMDGYHLDNWILSSRGILDRKGSPITFDYEGFELLVHRIKKGSDAVFPIFDRQLDLARAGAGFVSGLDSVIIFEGNYLLLKDKPWNALKPLFDLTVCIEVPRATLEERLTNRWLSHGFDLEDARRKVLQNDMVNVDLVQNLSATADVGFCSD